MEPVGDIGRTLDELHDDGNDEVHRCAHEESDGVGHRHGGIGQMTKVEQWSVLSEFKDNPWNEERGGNDDQRQRRG